MLSCEISSTKASLKNTVFLLVVREFNRMSKEPSRLLGILMQPLLFLVVFGAGFHRSFFWKESSSISYVKFFFPGILALVVLFSSIYATLTLVEDKKCGLFRLVSISPSGLEGAIIGKVLATTLIGFGQSCLFLPLMIFLDIHIPFISLFWVLILLLLGSLTCALLGVLLAWLSPSSAAFHGFMSVFLIPMWLLSGAMFPIDGTWFEKIGWINPMSYLVSALRGIFVEEPDFFLQVIYLVFFSFLITMLLILAVMKRPLE
ncbi:MAG: ABC transporter permease [Myxococcales bacterium]|nr:ABC transporter permease [Myxococcales bacterium]USN50222.1 MAG: ABC transporter permease [Myxococcales bacterium]